MLKGSAASGAAAGAANAAERCASANAPVSASVTQMVAATTLLFRERAGCTCWIGVSYSSTISEITALGLPFSSSSSSALCCEMRHSSGLCDLLFWRVREFQVSGL